MKIRPTTVIATVALGAVAAASTSAWAEDVDVSVLAGTGGRVIAVETLAGAELTEIDFGSATSMPFRVRVTDTNAVKKHFTVESTMTNLYLSPSDGVYTWASKIPSAELSIEDTLPNGAVVSDVVAHVQALVGVAVTFADSLALPCAALGLPVSGGSCTLPLGNVETIVHDLAVAVPDPSVLANLPLVPQAPEEDLYAVPDFTGPFALAPDHPGDLTGANTPTSLQLLAGNVSASAALLDELEGLLGDVLDDAGLGVGDKVDEAALLTAINTALGGLATPITSNLLLTTGTFSFVVPDLAADAITALTGTYMSIPALRVDTSDAPAAGTYRGRLTITAIETAP